MDVINLLISVILFCVVAYGVWWVCVRFGMPAPVLWLCGAVLLIVLILFLARQLGVSISWPRR